MITYDRLVDHNCLRFNVFSCCNLVTNYEFIVYVAFSRVYFGRQKFSFQTHMVRKTGAENRCQKMESIYGVGFWGVCGVSRVSFLGLHA